MRTVRRILRLLGFLVLLAIALSAGAIAVFTLTEKGRENLAGLISQMASSEGSTVTISGISGIWSGPLRVENVMLADTEGPWLAARGVAVDWSPWALLSSRFEASLVHADRVELARLPKDSGEESSGGSGLPVSLEIDRVDLPEVAIGGALAGEVAQVSAEGSLHAEAEPLAVRTDLRISRSNGKQGTLDAKIDFAPAENRLAAEIHGSEPAGGIIANALQLPGAPPVEIAVSGTGPAADWSVEGTLSVDGQVVTKVTGKRQLTDKGNRIEAKGEGAFERFIPEDFRALLAGQSTFDVAGTLGPDNAVAVEHATLQSAALTASAGGDINPAGASDFTLELAARDKPATLSFGEVSDAVTIEIGRLALHAFGTGEAPQLDASASIAKITSAEAEFTGVEAKAHFDAFDVRTLTGPLSLSATAQSGGSADDTIAGLLAGSPKVDAAGVLSEDSIRLTAGTVTTDTVSARVAGDISLLDGSLKLELGAELLSVLMPEAARSSLAERVNIAATLDRDAAGAILIEPVSVTSGDFNAAGRISYAPQALDVQLSGNLGDVSRFTDQAAGLIAFEASATGSPSTPDIATTISSDRLTVAGRQIDAFSMTAHTAIGSPDPAADVSLKGTVADQPLAATAALKFAGGQRRIDGLALTLGSNRISGDLALDEAMVPQGTLALELADIAPLAALAFEQATGEVNGTVTFSKAGNVPQIALEAKAPSLTRGDLVVKDAEVSAVIGNYLLTPSVSGKVVAGSLVSGTTTASNVNLSLTHDGTWTGFSGAVAVENINVKADGRFAVSGDTMTVELASASANGPGVNGALTAATTVTIKTADTSRDVVLNYSASDAPASFVFGDGPGAVTVSFRNVALHASGPADTPAVDLSARLDKVVTSEAELTGVEAKLHSDAFDINDLSGPVTLSASAQSGSSADAMVAGLLAGALRADVAATLSGDTLHVDRGTIASDAIQAELSGDISTADGSLKLDARANLLAALLPEAVRPALDRQVAITATVSRDASGAIRLDPLNVLSGPFDAVGSVSYAPDALAVQLKGGFADISKLAAQTAGSIGFDVSATGTPEAPDIAATISSDSFTAVGREITGLVVTASGKFDPVNPAANVSIKGDVAGQPLAGEAVLKTTDGQRRIDGLTLTLGNNRIAGNLALDAGFTPEGDLALTLPDIGPLAALALDSASGAVNGTVRFTKPGGVPQVSVDVQVPKIVRGDLSVTGAEVTAQIANYLLAPAISGKVKASSVTSGTTEVRAVDLTLTRDGAWTGFSGGATVNDIEAKATGRLAISNGVTTVELASGLAKTRGITATLARPTTISVKDGAATLDRLSLAVSGGTVQVTGTAGQQLNLDVQIAALPASAINTFAPGLGATGTISGSARISGASAKPDIGFTLDWTGAQTVQTRDAGFGLMTIASSGTLSSGVVKFTASLGDGSGLGAKGGGLVDTNARTLSLDFSGQLPFGFLTRRLAAQGLALSGTSNVSLSVRGPIGSPVLGGSISTSGARLVDARSGLAVNDIAAEIAIANGVATMRRLTGTLSSGGTVSGSGTVSIDAAKGFPADIAVKIGNARYTDGRIVTTNVTGDVAIKGPLASQPTLSGTVNLARTVITIPERLPASVSALNVRHRNAPAAVREQAAALRPETAGNSGSGLNLDLTVNAPEQIFVRGRGLDAELGGSIKLTGPLAAPRAIGEFTLRRGRLSVLARRLDFTRGTLGFSGSLIPTLDLAASSTISDATVTVGVIGLATDPKFTFTSSPALPEDEVLARLVFGRSMSNLSPLQIAQLADAAAQLAGAGGSTSLLNTLRGRLGVDDLDVTTDSEGRTAVTAGKYLNDRTYVTLQKGEKAGSGKATIDLDIGRGVKLRGEAADDGSAKGGIFYEREY